MNLIGWLWRHTPRPAEGWLALLAIAAAVLCVLSAVVAVEWVPEGNIVLITGCGGLLLATLLAKRPLPPLPSWLLLIVYGIVINTLTLARLWLPLSTLFSGWGPSTIYWWRNSALFTDRVGGWLKAVSMGDTSEETIVFAIGLGLLAWFLGAYTGWTAFRQKRPLRGLTGLALALAINNYYGQAPIWYAAIFISLIIWTATLLRYAHLALEWEANQVDYSDQVQLDLILYASGTAIVLMSLAMLVPSFSVTRLAKVIRNQPAVIQAEDTLERLFSGVTVARSEEGTNNPTGTLPRAFLVGDSPELLETVMMTAVVALPPDTPALPTGAHWQGLSYDIYTGRGWRLSEERQESIPANQPLPRFEQGRFLTVTQQIHWLFDDRAIRYTLGQPYQFDQEVTTFWRGLEDLAYVRGAGITYTVTSLIPLFNPEQQAETASATAVAPIPPAIMARYTQLPQPLPDRVPALAREITTGLTTPHQQAVAIEAFLRQYPYSLAVDLPPPDVDLVDYFLFEQQRGYCDYYASAMVVMARSLGLPARLAVGYLPQTPDAAGEQTIRQKDGHSWTEVYFAGQGWVEFEPTAAFTTPTRPQLTEGPIAMGQGPPQFDVAPTMPLPPRAEPEKKRAWPYLLAGGLVITILILIWRYGHGQKKRSQDDTSQLYGRLQQRAVQMGLSLSPSQTPYEFMAELHIILEKWSETPRLERLVKTIQPAADQLIRLFTRQQYGRETPAATAPIAMETWQNLKRPLWQLRIVYWWRRFRRLQDE